MFLVCGILYHIFEMMSCLRGHCPHKPDAECASKPTCNLSSGTGMQRTLPVQVVVKFLINDLNAGQNFNLPLVYDCCGTAHAECAAIYALELWWRATGFCCWLAHGFRSSHTMHWPL